MTDTSMHSLGSNDSYCLICCNDSKNISLPKLSLSNLANSTAKLTKAVEKIFRCLRLPQENFEKVKTEKWMLSFCSKCIVIMDEIIELQRKAEIIELQIQWKVETLGRIAIDTCRVPSAHTGNNGRPKAVAEIWQIFKVPVTRNFLEGLLPNPCVKLKPVNIKTDAGRLLKKNGILQEIINIEPDEDKKEMEADVDKLSKDDLTDEEYDSNDDLFEPITLPINAVRRKENKADTTISTKDKLQINCPPEMTECNISAEKSTLALTTIRNPIASTPAHEETHDPVFKSQTNLDTKDKNWLAFLTEGTDYFSCPSANCSFTAAIIKAGEEKLTFENAVKARRWIIEHYRTSRKHVEEHQNTLSPIFNPSTLYDSLHKRFFKCTKCDFKSYLHQKKKASPHPRGIARNALLFHFLEEHLFPWEKFPGLYKYGCFKKKCEGGDVLKCVYSHCDYSISIQNDLEGKTREECEQVAYQSFKDNHTVNHKFNAVSCHDLVSAGERPNVEEFPKEINKMTQESEKYKKEIKNSGKRKLSVGGSFASRALIKCSNSNEGEHNNMLSGFDNLESDKLDNCSQNDLTSSSFSKPDRFASMGCKKRKEQLDNSLTFQSSDAITYLQKDDSSNEEVTVKYKDMNLKHGIFNDSRESQESVGRDEETSAGFLRSMLLGPPKKISKGYLNGNGSGYRLTSLKEGIDYFACRFKICGFVAYIMKDGNPKQQLRNAAKARLQVIEHYRHSLEHFEDRKVNLSDITNAPLIVESVPVDVSAYNCTKCDFKSYLPKYSKGIYPSRSALVDHFLQEHVFPWISFPGLYKYGCYQEKCESGDIFKCIYSNCDYSTMIKYNLEGKTKEECVRGAYHSFIDKHARSHKISSISWNDIVSGIETSTVEVVEDTSQSISNPTREEILKRIRDKIMMGKGSPIRTCVPKTVETILILDDEDMASDLQLQSDVLYKDSQTDLRSSAFAESDRYPSMECRQGNRELDDSVTFQSSDTTKYQHIDEMINEGMTLENKVLLENTDKLKTMNCEVQVWDDSPESLLSERRTAEIDPFDSKSNSCGKDNIASLTEGVDNFACPFGNCSFVVCIKNGGNPKQQLKNAIEARLKIIEHYGTSLEHVKERKETLSDITNKFLLFLDDANETFLKCTKCDFISFLGECNQEISPTNRRVLALKHLITHFLQEHLFPWENFPGLYKYGCYLEKCVGGDILKCAYSNCCDYSIIIQYDLESKPKEECILGAYRSFIDKHALSHNFNSISFDDLVCAGETFNKDSSDGINENSQECEDTDKVISQKKI